jgi:hypothetical protein
MAIPFAKLTYSGSLAWRRRRGLRACLSSAKLVGQNWGVVATNVEDSRSEEGVGESLSSSTGRTVLGTLMIDCWEVKMTRGAMTKGRIWNDEVSEGPWKIRRGIHDTERNLAPNEQHVDTLSSHCNGYGERGHDSDRSGDQPALPGSRPPLDESLRDDLTTKGNGDGCSLS